VLIPESKIEEVRARVDFVGLVQRHGVELKKSGRTLKGNCPFHGENTPSFFVYPENKQFHCFGCQAHGDVFSFVQRLMGKTFTDTVQDLAREVGVDLEAAVDPSLKERQALKAVTDIAQEHFRQRLWEPTVGRTARDYLHSRGVPEDLARTFGLGWAPSAWSELADLFLKQGTLGFAEKAGLVAARPNGDGFYDVFRGRLIIPIRSAEGRTIAFGGRLLEGDQGPKYLNSRESRLYVKSDTLYGLDQAREAIRKAKTAVLCEGYFDCIGLHQAGVTNSVALCSTALTHGHLEALQRSDAKELVLMLDGDDAGRSAVERLAGPILAFGAKAKVAALPQGEDPDTFARRVGPEGVKKLVSEAPLMTEWLFRTILPEGPGASFEAKMGAVTRIKPVAQQLPVGLARSAFFGSMSKHFGLPSAELELELKGHKAAAQVKPVPKPAVPQNDQAPEPLEAYFVAAALKNRALLQKDSSHRADNLKHPGLRAVVAALATGDRREDLLETVGPRVARALEEVKLPAAEQMEQDFMRACLMLEIQQLKDLRMNLNRELAHLPDANNLTDEAKEKMAQMMRVSEKLQSLELGLKKTR
jgi:DNA primase